MADSDRYAELAARLNEERARLEGVRADYDVIAQSRFHSLRMLWFSLKAVFGFSSPDDVCATWSKGITPSLAGSRAQARARTVDFGEDDRALVEAWNRRIAARPPSAHPVATVVIPAFNHRDVTARCLRSKI